MSHSSSRQDLLDAPDSIKQEEEGTARSPSPRACSATRSLSESGNGLAEFSFDLNQPPEPLVVSEAEGEEVLLIEYADRDEQPEYESDPDLELDYIPCEVQYEEEVFEESCESDERQREEAEEAKEENTTDDEVTFKVEDIEWGNNSATSTDVKQEESEETTPHVVRINTINIPKRVRTEVKPEVAGKEDANRRTSQYSHNSGVTKSTRSSDGKIDNLPRDTRQKIGDNFSRTRSGDMTDGEKDRMKKMKQDINVRREEIRRSRDKDRDTGRDRDMDRDRESERSSQVRRGETILQPASRPPKKSRDSYIPDNRHDSRDYRDMRGYPNSRDTRDSRNTRESRDLRELSNFLLAHRRDTMSHDLRDTYGGRNLHDLRGPRDVRERHDPRSSRDTNSRTSHDNRDLHEAFQKSVPLAPPSNRQNKPPKPPDLPKLMISTDSQNRTIYLNDVAVTVPDSQPTKPTPDSFWRPPMNHAISSSSTQTTFAPKHSLLSPTLPPVDFYAGLVSSPQHSVSMSALLQNVRAAPNPSTTNIQFLPTVTPGGNIAALLANSDKSTIADPNTILVKLGIGNSHSGANNPTLSVLANYVHNRGLGVTNLGASNLDSLHQMNTNLGSKFEPTPTPSQQSDLSKLLAHSLATKPPPPLTLAVLKEAVNRNEQASKSPQVHFNDPKIFTTNSGLPKYHPPLPVEPSAENAQALQNIVVTLSSSGGKQVYQKDRGARGRGENVPRGRGGYLPPAPVEGQRAYFEPSIRGGRGGRGGRGRPREDDITTYPSKRNRK